MEASNLQTFLAKLSRLSESNVTTFIHLRLSGRLSSSELGTIVNSISPLSSVRLLIQSDPQLDCALRVGVS